MKLGWKVQILERGPGANVPAFERRKVYDTTQPGRGNSGHTFGDELTEEQRRAVIEYLKGPDAQKLLSLKGKATSELKKLLTLAPTKRKPNTHLMSTTPAKPARSRRSIT